MWCSTMVDYSCVFVWQIANPNCIIPRLLSLTTPRPGGVWHVNNEWDFLPGFVRDVMIQPAPHCVWHNVGWQKKTTTTDSIASKRGWVGEGMGNAECYADAVIGKGKVLWLCSVVGSDFNGGISDETVTPLKSKKVFWLKCFKSFSNMNNTVKNKQT